MPRKSYGYRPSNTLRPYRGKRRSSGTRVLYPVKKVIAAQRMWRAIRLRRAIARRIAARKKWYKLRPHRPYPGYNKFNKFR
jgi:hypothetical protein